MEKGRAAPASHSSRITDPLHRRSSPYGHGMLASVYVLQGGGPDTLRSAVDVPGTILQPGIEIRAA